MSDDNEFGLLTYLDELMDELHDNVPKALKDFDEDGIHDARVATRRLKAAMGLLRAVLSDEHRKDFEKVLKKVRRRLGPLRDLDVMIGHLSKLESHATHGKAAGWLKGQWETQRDHARSAARDKSSSAETLSKLGAWWHVREEVQEAREAVDSLLAQSLHLQLDSFAERAQGVERQANGSKDGAGRHDPHELRIAGKLLRYTLEVAQAQGHALPASVMRQFKRMQEALGNWHDDVVLVECAMQTSIGCMLAYHDSTLAERVLDLSRFFLRRAARELSNFTKLWQRRGDEVARIIRHQFPLTSAVSESKTGPDPSGSDGTPAPAPKPPDVASSA
jgi:CHAD domain-containing protein